MKPAICFLFILLFFTSCDPQNSYSKKKRIGVCQEHQGMSTFEANLYEDSTFYQPGNPLVGYSFGKFRVSRDTVSFETQGGEQNLCPGYIFDEKEQHYVAGKGCHSDPLNIYWDKRLAP